MVMVIIEHYSLLQLGLYNMIYDYELYDLSFVSKSHTHLV